MEDNMELENLNSSSNSNSPSANSDLPYGGNPFAGDNFWNIFAGGNNPSNSARGGSAPSVGGGNPFGGNTASDEGNPLAGVSDADKTKLLEQSPFGPLKEVVGDDLYKIFDGGGNPSSSGGFPTGGSNSSSASASDSNPFANEDFWKNFAGSGNISGGGSTTTSATSAIPAQQSPFSRLNVVSGDSTSTGGSNPFGGSFGGGSNPFGGSFGGGSNPVAGGSFGGGSNPIGGGSFGGGSNPFGGNPFTGNGNVYEGEIGNSSFANGLFALPISDDPNLPWPLGKGEIPVGDEKATANNNVTVGNGNWYYAADNKTLGNGNWYYESGNATIGNGNWHFGSDNATIGNGNWYLGSDNVSLGNGNRPNGDGNTIMGNGNSFTGDNNVVSGSPLSNGRIFTGSDNFISGDGNSLLAVNREVFKGEAYDDLIDGGLKQIVNGEISNDQLHAQVDSFVLQTGEGFMKLITEGMKFDQPMMTQGSSTTDNVLGSISNSGDLAPISSMTADNSGLTNLASI